MKTYWLYFGRKVLTAVRMMAGMSRQQVIAHAIEQHNRMPLCMPEYRPFEFTIMLEWARVFCEPFRP